MPLARIGTKMVYFSHIPKAGGSSIETYLRTKGSVALVSKGDGWGKSSPQHMPLDVAQKWIPEGFCDARFAVVRDPVERLASTFRMRARPDRMRSPLDWLTGLRGKLRGEPLFRIRLLRVPVLIDFRSWVALSLALQRVFPSIQDNHLRPQVDYVGEGMTVFRLEDGLGPVFDWIDGIAGTPRSPGTFHQRKGQPLDLPLDASLRDRIRRRYLRDYEMIAHHFPGQAA